MPWWVRELPAVQVAADKCAEGGGVGVRAGRLYLGSGGGHTGKGFKQATDASCRWPGRVWGEGGRHPHHPCLERGSDREAVAKEEGGVGAGGLGCARAGWRWM